MYVAFSSRVVHRAAALKILSIANITRTDLPTNHVIVFNP